MKTHLCLKTLTQILRFQCGFKDDEVKKGTGQLKSSENWCNCDYYISISFHNKHIQDHLRLTTYCWYSKPHFEYSIPSSFIEDHLKGKLS